jgi:hypothetical protein
VQQARTRARNAQRKLDALRSNPAAYNAFLPTSNALVDRYNRLLRRLCEPR